MKPFSFSSTDELSEVLGNKFYRHLARLNIRKKQVNLAFSGGRTPAAFFDILVSNQKNPETKTDWGRVHVFWVDERCVAPDHPESNYRMTAEHLLRPLNLDKDQIHRIRGENEPGAEAIRYAAEIRDAFHQSEGLPVFDWIFLGMGEDGHTASIFPDRLDLIHTPALCAVTSHPVTGQFRITLTGQVIMQADRISYLVTGSEKSTVVRQIIQDEPEAAGYPAKYIRSVKGKVHWYLDADAARQLNSEKSDQ
jgi:6-phosphogluconolactonase